MSPPSQTICESVAPSFQPLFHHILSNHLYTLGTHSSMISYPSFIPHSSLFPLKVKDQTVYSWTGSSEVGSLFVFGLT